jgi:hypothetical protein
MHQAHLCNAHLPCAHSWMMSRVADALPLKTRHATVQHGRGRVSLRRTASVAATAPQRNVEAVVLVDHGSKRAEANAMLEQFADIYRFVCSRMVNGEDSALVTVNYM